MPDVSFSKFELAFWHPFGSHGREPPKDIIRRKRSEIEANGWTLWSFQFRQMLDDWHQKLCSAKPKTVFVFCSESPAAVDPARDGTSAKPTDCKKYRFVGNEDTEWHAMPRQVRVPHPFRPSKNLASAFVVQRVHYPIINQFHPVVEWFSQNEGPWRQDRIPTRGEYLIRLGGVFPIRRVSAVLELKPPYLAIVCR